MTLEPNGNLHAYYWGGTRWAAGYTTITEASKLLTTCGAYSVCAQPRGGCECPRTRDGSGCAAAASAPGVGEACATPLAVKSAGCTGCWCTICRIRF